MNGKTMNGAQVVASILKQEGVKHIIGFPNSELFDASAELDIPPVITRTQRVAVNIAEGYARTTAGAELAVVTVQYGPGRGKLFRRDRPGLQRSSAHAVSPNGLSAWLGSSDAELRGAPQFYARYQVVRSSKPR